MTLVWSEIVDQARRSVEAALGSSHAGEDGAVTEHPTQESLDNIKHNFSFADAGSWDEAKENFDMEHPAMKEFVEDVRQRGVQKPVRIDYEQSPPEVVDGHQRLVAADAAGLSHVPVKHGTFADVHYYGE